MDKDKYIKESNENIELIFQIEGIEGFNNIEQIINHENIFLIYDILVNMRVFFLKLGKPRF